MRGGGSFPGAWGGAGAAVGFWPLWNKGDLGVGTWRGRSGSVFVGSEMMNLQGRLVRVGIMEKFPIQMREWDG